MTTTSRAWRALSERLITTLPPAARESLVRGSHVRRFEDNLLPGISIGQAAALRAQLEGGAGGELKQTKTGKRPAHAPYSSATLAINAFGPWLGHEAHLRVVRLGGFDRPLTVEHKLLIKHGGGTANLDCYLEGPAIVVGVESKLTEHLSAHKPVAWKEAYRSAEMGSLVSAGWAELFADSLAGRWSPGHAGVEQLIKHALALNNQADRREQHLVYCYWEPENGSEFDEVLSHREEVAEFLERVGDAPPRLHPISYIDLVDEWSSLKSPDWVRQHVADLYDRYVLSI
jgi:hypothetical protein